MGDFLSNLALGFSVAFTPGNLLAAFSGCLIGTLIGVLPGIGSVPTVAMLLPLTFYLPPEAGIIMLAGIFYGAQYGGSTTAILVNLPGESSSVVTCLDGYQMARRGRAGPALAVAALASLFAGSVSTLLIAAFAPPLARIGQSFGAPEYFALMTLGLVAAVILAHGSILKAIAMIFLGLLLGLVGTDTNTGGQRFTFGMPALFDGISFVAVAVGIFGLGEIIANLAGRESDRSILTTRITGLWPTRDDFRRSWPAVLRGTGIGSVLGVLPGGGSILSSFAAYMVEKKIARDPSRFGQGAIEGVASPEAANNAGAQTSFIPMLTLGIPGNAMMALLAGALMVHGIQPGPRVMLERPGLFWGLIASMWIGNLMLVIINLPLISIWVRLLAVPYRMLYLAVLLFCAIGAYSVNNSAFEVIITGAFGLLGYVFIRLECPPAPLLLGFILGPLMEENLRRAMLISGGDPGIFVSRPISLGLLLAAILVLLIVVLPGIRRRREVALKE